MVKVNGKTESPFTRVKMIRSTIEDYDLLLEALCEKMELRMNIKDIIVYSLFGVPINREDIEFI